MRVPLEVWSEGPDCMVTEPPKKRKPHKKRDYHKKRFPEEGIIPKEERVLEEG